MAKVTFTDYIPSQIPLFGQLVTIEVKRMDIDEFLPWEEKYFEYGQSTLGDTEQPAKKADTSGFFQWMRQSMTDYVRVPAGEVDDPHGQPVLTGERFDALLGARADVKAIVMTSIWMGNRLDEVARKKLLSLSGLATTSDAPHQGVAGPKPEQIADSAALPASVATEAAGPVDGQTVPQSGATTEA